MNSPKQTTLLDDRCALQLPASFRRRAQKLIMRAIVAAENDLTPDPRLGRCPYVLGYLMAAAGFSPIEVDRLLGLCLPRRDSK